MYPNVRGKARRHGDKTVRVATHVPALELGCSAVKPEFVIEHGMGLGSTPFFHRVSSVKRILSFENEARWATCDRCPASPGLEHVIAPFSPDGFAEKTSVFDSSRTIALVDGEAAKRPVALELSMKLGVPWIVEHDAECCQPEEVDARVKLCVQHGYSAFQYMLLNPESLVYVKPQFEAVLKQENGFVTVFTSGSLQA